MSHRRIPASFQRVFTSSAERGHGIPVASPWVPSSSTPSALAQRDRDANAGEN
jgi:hypothetical protein